MPLPRLASRIGDVAHAVASLAGAASYCHLASPRPPRDRRPFRRVLVLADGPNPSCDYYLAVRLAADTLPFDIVDMRETGPDRIDWRGAHVVVCRYLAPEWRAVLTRAGAELARLTLFLDDDLEALAWDRSQPLRYRWRVATRGLATIRDLGAHLDGVWVSTPVLADRLRAARPRIVPPAPDPVDLLTSLDAPAVTPDIAFHATASHAEEHEFAMKVVTALARRRPETRFDVVAAGRLAAAWRRIGVEPSAPMPWPVYRARADRIRPALFIVPMMAGRANDARAPTKAIDVVRTGAAGVFSDAPAYRCLAGGLPLLPADPDLWAKETARLLDDAAERKGLAVALRKLVASWQASRLPIDSGSP